MNAPVIRAAIDRRILVNDRIDADVLAAALPERFRPPLVQRPQPKLCTTP